MRQIGALVELIPSPQGSLMQRFCLNLVLLRDPLDGPVESEQSKTRLIAASRSGVYGSAADSRALVCLQPGLFFAAYRSSSFRACPAKSLPSGLTRGWEPVLRKRTCSNKGLEQDDDSRKSHPVLSAMYAPPTHRNNKLNAAIQVGSRRYDMAT